MVKIRSITKEAFLTAHGCRTQGWLLLNDEGSTPTEGQLLRMAEGNEVHKRAQKLHPDGVYAGSAKTTQHLLDSDTEVIFEAAFKAESYAARADWLRREGDGFIVGEVKSGLFKEEGPPDDLIDDMAYTVSVLRRAGVNVLGAELVQLNREWRIGMPDTDLFITSNQTELVEERAGEFDEVWDAVGKSLASSKRPKPQLCWECRHCEFFGAGCIGEDVEHPLWTLPHLNQNRFEELLVEGITTVEAVPEDFKLSDTQMAVAQAIRTGDPILYIDELTERLAEVEWPAAYLDFETLKTAIPYWPGIAPHEQVVTQYSIHVYEDFGVETAHREYLAQADRDCRRDLAERLIEDLEDVRSIVVYSSFEKTVIGGLAKRFPDLQEELEGLQTWLFDLEPVVRKGYIHPEFKGRSSIKVVVPVFAPELSYEELEIGEGGSAIAAFAKMAKGGMLDTGVVQLRKDLLAYCEVDTLAMVRVHEELKQLSE